MNRRPISPADESSRREIDYEDQHLDGDHVSLEHAESDLSSQVGHQGGATEAEEEHESQPPESSTTDTNIENNSATHISYAREVAESSEDSESSDQIHEPAEPRFNVSTMPTPSSHAYLGEASSGTNRPRTDLEAGSTVEIPILSLPGVILFPGESLPLRLYNPAYAQLALSMLEGESDQDFGGGGARGAGSRSDVSSERTSGTGESKSSSSFVRAKGHLGVVNRITWQSGGMIQISSVGTTAEVRSGRSLGGDLNYVDSGLAIMAQGRHRFRFLEDLGWRRGVRFWKVMICPDVCPAPLRAPVPRAFRVNSARSPIWAMALPRFAVAVNCPNNLVARAQALLRDEMGSIRDKEYIPGRRARGRQHATRILGPKNRREALARAARVRLRKRAVPKTEVRQKISHGESSDMYRRQGATAVAREEDTGYVSSKEEERGDGAGDEGADDGGNARGRPRRPDPTFYSFWLAANLPLDDEARQELLIIDSVVMRLRLEIKHLEESRRRNMQCSECGVSVADVKDIFTLPGAEGVVGAYVNPQGHVHQTLTVRNAREINLQEGAETEHSWFPGYAWTIADCARCSHHLGWLFTAVTSSSRLQFSGSIRRITDGASNGAEDRQGGASSSGTQVAAGEGTDRQSLGPEWFYGLRRSALKYPDERGGEEEEEEEEEKAKP